MKKRLECICLTLIVLFVYIGVLPSYAAAVISISETAETQITPKQNSGIEGTATVNSDDTVALSTGQWISYDISITKAGNYKVLAYAKTSTPNVTLYVDNTGVSTRVLRNNATTYISHTLGRANLTAGMHTIKFLVNSGTVTVNKFRVKCVDLVIAQSGVTMLEAEDYLATNIDEPSKVDLQWNYGATTSYVNTGCVYFDASKYTDYNFNLENDGCYKLTLYEMCTVDTTRTLTVSNNGSTLGSAAVVKTGSASVVTPVVVGVIPLNTGMNTIRIQADSGSAQFAIYCFALEKVSERIKIDSAYANGNPFSNNSLLSRGYDSLKISFSQPISPNSVNSDTIKLTSNGNTLDTYFSTTVSDVYITVKKTFDYDTEYMLLVNGVKDSYGAFSVSNVNLSFVTNGIDDGTASTQINSAVNNYRDITLVGIMKSSMGTGIEGRRVDVNLIDTADVLKSSVVATAISGTDGSFTINYTLPSNSQSGIYTFVVGGEYVNAPQRVSLNYISRETELEILSKFSTMTDIENVKSLFNEYSQAFGLAPEADLVNVPFKDEVFQYFIGAQIKRVEELKIKYYTYIALETINQATDTNMIENILQYKTKCDYLGLSNDKMDLIVKNRSGFLTDILNLSAFKNVDSFAATIDEITDRWLALEYNKNASNSAATNLSVYTGQSFPVSLNFAELQRNISKITYIFECDDANLFEVASVDLTISGSTSINKTNGKLIVEIIPTNNQNSFASIGNLNIMAAGTATVYNITISGTVQFNENIAYPIFADITSKQIAVTASVNSSKGTIITTSSSTGVSSKSTTPIPSPTPTPTPTPTTESFKFSDLDSVEWAQEAINYLLVKGIVSESENKCFNPNDNVTREQFVKMIVVALRLEQGSYKTSLSDVNADGWYYPYVVAAEQNKLITGDANGRFGVGANITRQDMAVIIFRVVTKLGHTYKVGEDKFSDDALIANYANDAVYAMESMKILNGVGENRFAPQDNATKAMAAKVIYEMIKAVGL